MTKERQKKAKINTDKMTKILRGERKTAEKHRHKSKS